MILHNHVSKLNLFSEQKLANERRPPAGGLQGKADGLRVHVLEMNTQQASDMFRGAQQEAHLQKLILSMVAVNVLRHDFRRQKMGEHVRDVRLHPIVLIPLFMFMDNDSPDELWEFLVGKGRV